MISIIVVHFVGCGDVPRSITTLQDVSLQSVPIGQSFLDPESEAASSSGTELWQPPFPDRDNPFLKADDPASAANPLAATDVKLVGFAKLIEQQAILRFPDSTRFMARGDHHNNVELVDILPPHRVRLRSNNLVWEVSLLGRRTD
ncbi:MAG: hypothetical protein AAGJ40_02010 [Planctomycetota bacterium]